MKRRATAAHYSRRHYETLDSDQVKRQGKIPSPPAAKRRVLARSSEIIENVDNECRGVLCRLHWFYLQEKCSGMASAVLRMCSSSNVPSDRRGALSAYSDILNSADGSSQLSKGHASLELYGIMWASPTAQEIGPLVDRARCSLLVWYIRHCTPSSMRRTVASVIKSLQLFNFDDPSNVPRPLFDEVRNHISRITALCAFDELALLLLCQHKHSTLDAHGQALLNFLRVNSPRSLRKSLLAPEEHSAALLLAKKLLLSEANNLDGPSIWQGAVSILIGDEDNDLDRYLQEALSCLPWCGTFICGFFWRNLSSSALEDLTEALPPDVDEVGDIIACLFTNWQDCVPGLSQRALESDDAIYAHILSNDIDSLIKCLEKEDFTLNPTVPYLVDLILEDHHVVRASNASCIEILLRKAAKETTPYRSVFLARAAEEVFCQIRQEALFITSTHPTLQRTSGRRVYAWRDEDDDENEEEVRDSPPETADERNPSLIILTKWVINMVVSGEVIQVEAVEELFSLLYLCFSHGSLNLIRTHLEFIVECLTEKLTTISSENWAKAFCIGLMIERENRRLCILRQKSGSLLSIVREEELYDWPTILDEAEDVVPSGLTLNVLLEELTLNDLNPNTVAEVEHFAETIGLKKVLPPRWEFLKCLMELTRVEDDLAMKAMMSLRVWWSEAKTDEIRLCLEYITKWLTERIGKLDGEVEVELDVFGAWWSEFRLLNPQESLCCEKLASALAERCF